MRKPCVVCGDPVHGHGYCSKHWQRWVKFGDPLAMARKPYIRGTYAERFWSHVRACVNPAHLEPVTHAENIRRRYSRQVSA